MLLKFVKEKTMILPTPIGGLALAIASLGWAWENIFNLNGYGQLVGAGLASMLILLLAAKFLLHPQLLKADLAHPIVGSVVPTFAMTVMVISNSIGHFNARIGDGLWLLALLLHLYFLISFLYHRTRRFKIEHMVPSWFIPPVGIIVADVAFSGNSALMWLAHAVLVLGMTVYALMLPLMIYRIIFVKKIPDVAQPTLAILAAPASLSLAGYFSVVAEPDIVIVSLFLVLAILMTFIIYIAFFKLLRRPFCPGYAAFTFPMVIGATALFKFSDWMVSSNIDVEYINPIQSLALFELMVATLVVSYVALRYFAHFTPLEMNFRSNKMVSGIVNDE